ncbi:glucose-6-phosphate isomerase [Curvibacter sp. HBC61]|uniref:Glucose-6-phosphate isomerase n=1 Tax=Curvibacter cyanobacteriorum TaxID=3026422 RepID=A0ABT5MYX3_9BURK|nr:glucose-6-phosphate isomerase [Curvibacter sp. HBC61]MDD0839090.1 glucose-6-phosphate isomerase [Curvibacter sp. HBC61]
MTQRLRCDETPAWTALQAHYEQVGRHFDVRADFEHNPDRFAQFSQQAPHVFADLSKNRIDAQAEALLLQLAEQCGLVEHRDAMFAGGCINSTEHRAVMHYLLRNQAVAATSQEAAAPVLRGAVADAAMPEVNATLRAMLAFAEAVRADEQITDIVNIGIGGSDLGPQMAVVALQAYAIPGKRFHFVSNVDGDELGEVLTQIRPHSTLFLVASKTFTTRETMTNAHSARQWFLDQAGPGADLGRHFAALTTNLEAAQAFGIRTTFGFRDWVGGRYSMWSAIGLPLAIAIGEAGFRALLGGAHAMDQHFLTAPLAKNLPVRLGLLDVWYRNFHGFSSRSVAPYHHGLRRLPAYLQQLEMESNGKRVDVHGRALSYSTSPVVWGEPGTNGQHAFFQMIHQGTDIVPVEFIAVREPAHDMPGHHAQLVANALAQAQALLQGRSDAGGHRHFPGNRPSSFFVMERMEPVTLGALIALYEHRVFVSGSIWGINSFDQWGVELGKQLAQDIQPRLATGDVHGLDPSTAGLLRQFRPRF